MGGFSGGSGGGLSASGIAGLNSGTPDGNSIVPFVFVTPAVEASARVMHFTFGVNPSTDDELPAISGITGLVLKEAAGEYDFPNIAVIAGDLAATLGALADQLELHKTDEGYESLANYSYTADGSTLIITAITTGVNTDTFGASTGNVTVSEATPGADASPETYTLKQSAGGLVSGDLPTATVINPDTDTIVAEVMTVVVAGAGSPEVDGTLLYTGRLNGYAKYVNANDADHIAQVEDAGNGLRWNIIDTSGNYAYQSGQTADNYASIFDVDDWEAGPDNGQLPAPTLTAVPVTMQVSREVLTAGLMQIKTTTVDTSVGTTQALLDAVPSGKERIVTQVIFRAASAAVDYSSFGAGLGFNNTGWYPSDLFLNLPNASAFNNFTNDNTNGVVGAASDVFGITFFETDTNATVKIDVLYFDVDA